MLDDLGGSDGFLAGVREKLLQRAHLLSQTIEARVRKTVQKTYPSQMDAGKSPPSLDPTQGARMPLRVLVVDDDHDTADSFAQLVYLFGHVARPVYSGASALEHVDEFKPHVVCLDLGMPEMNGFETACRLRKTGKPVALVAMTGHRLSDVMEPMKACGFDLYLLKPIDPDELERLLDEYATQFGMQRRPQRVAP